MLFVRHVSKNNLTTHSTPYYKLWVEDYYFFFTHTIPASKGPWQNTTLVRELILLFSPMRM